MNAVQFDLKFLLSLTTAFCVALWAVLAQSPGGVLLAVVFSAVIFACHGATSGHWPSVCGSIAGALTVPLMIAGFFAQYIVSYYKQGTPDDYFEDGWEVELTVYPIVYVLVYTPIGALLGLGCGFIAGQLWRLAHQQPDDGDSRPPGE